MDYLTDYTFFFQFKNVIFFSDIFQYFVSFSAFFLQTVAKYRKYNMSVYKSLAYQLLHYLVSK